jgi:hypothetical protein
MGEKLAQFLNYFVWFILVLLVVILIGNMATNIWLLVSIYHHPEPVYQTLPATPHGGN